MSDGDAQEASNSGCGSGRGGGRGGRGGGHSGDWTCLRRCLLCCQREDNPAVDEVEAVEVVVTETSEIPTSAGESQKGNEDTPAGAGENTAGDSRRGSPPRRPVDWMCENCGNSSFSFGTECQKCSEAILPAGAGGDAPEPTYDKERSPSPTEIFSRRISSGIKFFKYENIQIKISGENPVAHADSFEGFGLRRFVLNKIIELNCKTPSPLQKHAIPIIMAGRDLMACAPAGSGKTAAFMVPIINTLLDRSPELAKRPFHCQRPAEPQAIVLGPGELAIHLEREARKFARGSALETCILYSGTYDAYENVSLREGCHILVGTPDRVRGFLEQGRLSFGSVRFFVLYEADQMIDQGFLPDMLTILKHPTLTPPTEFCQRQTIMFSASFPNEVQRLASQFLTDYLFLAVGIVGACSDVEQTFIEVEKSSKYEKLKEILVQSCGELTLVFFESQRKANFVGSALGEEGFPIATLLGELPQRKRALAEFTSGKRPTLIATDFAVLLTDIKHVAHVVNFDLPEFPQTYMNRIERVRVRNNGRVTSLFDPTRDSAIAGKLPKILEKCGQEVPSFLGGSASGSGARDVRRGGRGDDENSKASQTDWYWW